MTAKQQRLLVGIIVAAIITGVSGVSFLPPVLAVAVPGLVVVLLRLLWIQAVHKPMPSTPPTSLCVYDVTAKVSSVFSSGNTYRSITVDLPHLDKVTFMTAPHIKWAPGDVVHISIDRVEGEQ